VTFDTCTLIQRGDGPAVIEAGALGARCSYSDGKAVFRNIPTDREFSVCRYSIYTPSPSVAFAYFSIRTATWLFFSSLLSLLAEKGTGLLDGT